MPDTLGTAADSDWGRAAGVGEGAWGFPYTVHIWVTEGLHGV